MGFPTPKVVATARTMLSLAERRPTGEFVAVPELSGRPPTRDLPTVRAPKGVPHGKSYQMVNQALGESPAEISM